MKKIFTLLAILVSLNCFASEEDTLDVIVVNRELKLQVDTSVKRAEYSIFNFQGELVGGGVFKETATFPFNELPTGLYIVRLFGDDKFYWERFYKKY